MALGRSQSKGNQVYALSISELSLNSIFFPIGSTQKMEKRTHPASTSAAVPPRRFPAGVAAVAGEPRGGRSGSLRKRSPSKAQGLLLSPGEETQPKLVRSLGRVKGKKTPANPKQKREPKITTFQPATLWLTPTASTNTSAALSTSPSPGGATGRRPLWSSGGSRAQGDASKRDSVSGCPAPPATPQLVPRSPCPLRCWFFF